MSPPSPASSNPPLDARGLPEGFILDAEWEIAPADLKRALDAGDVMLLDCRQPGERATARIGDETLVPLGELASRLEELRERADRPIVVYCHRGGRSLRAAKLLRQHGFGDARSLAGGIDLWSIAIDPTVPRY